MDSSELGVTATSPVIKTKKIPKQNSQAHYEKRKRKFKNSAVDSFVCIIRVHLVMKFQWIGAVL